MPGRAGAKADRGAIAAISVCGYKSIRETYRIELRPLTLLAGANSSGKSSMMQPLLLLKQTLEAPYDPGPLRLDGPNVRFTSADQLLSLVKSGARRSEFSVRLEAANGSSLELTFSRSKQRGFDIKSMAYTTRGSNFGELRPGMTQDEIRPLLSPPLVLIHEGLLKKSPGDFEWSVARDRCFLYVALQYKVPGGPPEATRVIPSGFAEPAIRGIIHLPGLRGNPERTFKTTAVGDYFIGEFQDYVASIVTQWQARETELLERLARDLEKLGLTSRIKARPVNDTQVQLEVGRLLHSQRGGARDLVNIADVGFGVSQTLPVLVALLVARPGQIVYLEQPELHLHPKAQVRLAGVLAEAAKRQVIVVAETHSSLLLRSVQTLVAKGELAPELVKLHWFHRREDGVTEVNSTDLDDRGRFEKGWPQDFDEVALRAEGEYLDAVDARQ